MQDTTLPEPLVPAEVDLSDFGFMPLDVRRLLTSETWIEASDDPRIGHAAMSLWAEAWHQVPCGSLPDNDKVLLRLSMCPSAKEWARVRDRVLEGWVRCSDGRLYHPVVAEKAMEAWGHKRAQRQRTRLATEARERKRRERDAQRNDERDVQRDVQRDESRYVHQGTGTGTGTVKSFPLSDLPAAHISPAPEPVDNSAAPPAPADAGNGENPPEDEGNALSAAALAMAVALRAKGVTVTANHPTLLTLIDKGVTITQAIEALEIARQRKGEERIPVGYLAAIVEGEILNPKAAKLTGPAWWTTEQLTEAKGRELGLTARPSESWAEYRARITTEIHRRKTGGAAA